MRCTTDLAAKFADAMAARERTIRAVADAVADPNARARPASVPPKPYSPFGVPPKPYPNPPNAGPHQYHAVQQRPNLPPSAYDSDEEASPQPTSGTPHDATTMFTVGLQEVEPTYSLRTYPLHEYAKGFNDGVEQGAYEQGYDNGYELGHDPPKFTDDSANDGLENGGSSPAEVAAAAQPAATHDSDSDDDDDPYDRQHVAYYSSDDDARLDAYSEHSYDGYPSDF